MTLYTPEVGDRITKLLAEFKLSSAAEQTTKRLLDASCDQALVILAEVLEVDGRRVANAASIASGAHPGCRPRRRSTRSTSPVCRATF